MANDLKKWKAKLSAMDHAVNGHQDPHLAVVRSGSPSVNALFGNSGRPDRGWGLPRRFSLLLGGPPKGGKSTLLNSMIGQFLVDNPGLFAIKIDSEYKESVQTTPEDLAKWRIDPERYQCFERNDPELIDFIDGPLLAMIQDGLPLGLLALDCFSNMDGFRASEAATAAKANSQIGDNARTSQMFMAKVLPILRRQNVAFIGTAHVGAEMDPLEQKRGHKLRIKTAAGTNHRIEYWCMVERDLTVAGRKDLLEREFVREGAVRTGKEGKVSDTYAHKIKVEMMGSSFGPVGREAIFTYDYDRGIVNTHEEVFTLAKANGLITVGGGGVYSYGGQSWRGLANTLGAIEKDTALYQRILHDLMTRDSGEHSPMPSPTP